MKYRNIETLKFDIKNFIDFKYRKIIISHFINQKVILLNLFFFRTDS
jgi:hypothetical protein